MNFLILLLQLLPETVLVLTALVLLGMSAFAGGAGRTGKVPYLAVASLGILAAAVALALEPARDGSGSPLVAMDALARIIKAVLLGLGLLAVWLPPADGRIKDRGEFLALMLFSLTGMMLAVGTNHLLFLFVSLELAGLPLYLSAGFPKDARAAEASLKYFLSGAVSAAFLLFGISLLYGFSHSAMLPVVSARLGGEGQVLAMAGLLLVMVGLGFKVAAAPFHAWAPDVYQGAPATAVGLVAAASKLTGLALMVRLLVVTFHDAAGSASWGAFSAGWSVWLAVLAVISILTGNLLALSQTGVRRLLGYSAVANTGYLLTGLAANGPASAGAALFHGITYGLATFGALAITAAVERDRGDDSRTGFAGLSARSPFLALALLVCLASLAGLPPMAGFVSKFALFSSALRDAHGATHSGLFWLVALAVAMSAVSLRYYLAILKQAFVAEGPGGLAPLRLGLSHRLAVGVPAFLLLWLGLFPALLLDPLTAAVHTLLGLR